MLYRRVADIGRLQFYKRFQGTFTLGYLVKFSLRELATKGDLDNAIAFFKDKDVTKYAMPLEQSLDGIRANVKWLEVSFHRSMT
jgi:aminopeptidase 2